MADPSKAQSATTWNRRVVEPKIVHFHDVSFRVGSEGATEVRAPGLHFADSFLDEQPKLLPQQNCSLAGMSFETASEFQGSLLLDRTGTCQD